MRACIWTLIFSIFAPIEAYAQSSMCVPGAISVPYRSVSSTKFFRNDFFNHVGDLEYIPKDKPYAQLYVKASRLNVRDAPNGLVVGKLFKGQKVFVYARQGKWLAIRRLERPLWVHQSYLGFSARDRVSLKELQTVCSLEDMSLMLSKDVKTTECKSVAAFVVWNNGHKYETALAEYMRNKGNDTNLGKLAHCQYQLFQSSLYY